MDTSLPQDYVSWFRNSTPYISAHRGRTFVVLLPAEALAHQQLTNIVHDLALLHVLGVRLVVLHGSRAQVDAESSDQRYVGERRITDAETMERIVRINGTLRSQLEALFSMGLPATPMHNTDIPVVSGNFVAARPIGVIDGVDHVFTGQVRKVHTERINALLETRSLVLMPPMGYSPSGQAFNLAAHELASDVALALRADKLIVFDREPFLRGRCRATSGCALPPARQPWRIWRNPPAITSRACCARFAAACLGATCSASPTTARCWVSCSPHTASAPRSARKAPGRYAQPSLRTLPTSSRSSARWKRAGSSYGAHCDRLEQEIGHFFVAEVDGIVVGTCALYPQGALGELACVAVKSGFQSNATLNIGSRLVQTAEAAARAAGLNTLFVLTTQAEDWFLGQGFKLSSRAALPEQRKALYNDQRASKVMTKQLSKT